MVCEMDTGNNSSGEEPTRSSSAGPTAANCSSARQSPKVAVQTPTPTPIASSPAVALLHHRNSASPSVPRKIMSKNNNNTMFPTSYPSNLAELQLYRVMQNASLLFYYDTLLEMGGDDVQQLCDAGEEEFLEIMSLVGMASKPLHVRRLQKSLQEWVTNPNKFKIPLVPGEDFELELSSPRVTSNHGFYAMESGDSNRTIYSPSPGEVCALPPVASPGICLTKRPYSPLDVPSCPPSSSSSPGSSTSLQLTPVLLESQIAKLAAAAERLSKHLPQFEPKPHNAKKKVCKELELVMSMPENDPRRMEEIRRYAAIYGRFDCKRRPEKPLTLHEVSVNEAAAQICRFVPALLTRRDELFPLARQVVKDSGCHYSKTQLSSMYIGRGSIHDRDVSDNNSGSARASPRIPNLDNDCPPLKRPKIEPADPDCDEQQRQEKNNDEVLIMRPTLHSLFQHHNKASNRESSGGRNFDYDDADSHFSFSNSSSPSQVSGQEQEVSMGENNVNHRTVAEEQTDIADDASKFSPKVIAASGDNIIAVANPALAMSPAILPVTSLSAETRESRKHDPQ